MRTCDYCDSIITDADEPTYYAASIACPACATEPAREGVVGIHSHELTRDYMRTWREAARREQGTHTGAQLAEEAYLRPRPSVAAAWRVHDLRSALALAEIAAAGTLPVDSDELMALLQRGVARAAVARRVAERCEPLPILVMAAILATNNRAAIRELFKREDISDDALEFARAMST